MTRKSRSELIEMTISLGTEVGSVREKQAVIYSEISAIRTTLETMKMILEKSIAHETMITACNQDRENLWKHVNHTRNQISNLRERITKNEAQGTQVRSVFKQVPAWTSLILALIMAIVAGLTNL